MLKCRTWPGEPRDSRTDFWRGPGEHHSAYHEVFDAAVNVPDLLTGIGRVPGSARAEHTTIASYADDQNKKKRDLQYLFTMFADSFTRGDELECRQLLELECTPLDEEIAFDWPQTDLDFLYKSVQHQPLGGQHSELLSDEDPSDDEAMDVPDRYTSFAVCWCFVLHNMSVDS